jgi:hypothetical protein
MLVAGMMDASRNRVRRFVLIPIVVVTSLGCAYFAWAADRVFGMLMDSAYPRPAPYPDRLIVAFHEALGPTEAVEGHLYGIQFLFALLAFLCLVTVTATATILWKWRRLRLTA